jgi:hypothetical protein
MESGSRRAKPRTGLCLRTSRFGLSLRLRGAKGRELGLELSPSGLVGLSHLVLDSAGALGHPFSELKPGGGREKERSHRAHQRTA